MFRFASVPRLTGQGQAVPGKINLHEIRIASPCTSEWSKMTGNERTRHCPECNLDVHNFAAMTPQEIEELLASSGGGRICARIYRRVDGTMLTRDCPKGLRAAWKTAARVAGAALSALMSVNFAGAQTGAKQQCSIHGREIHESGLILNVMDPDGALVPKADITLTRKDGRKKKRTGVSNAEGRLMFDGLKATDYMLLVQAKGFRPANIPVTLNEGKVSTLQIRLQVGKVETQVEVVPSGSVVVEVGVLSELKNSPIPIPSGAGPGGASRPLKQ